MKKHACRVLKNQRGFGSLEVLIALVISSLVIISGTTYYMRYLDRQANMASSGHMNIVADAATQYIKDNYAAVLAIATPTVPALITLPMLRTTGYLPSGFADKNAHGQEYRVMALEPTPDKLETLIVTEYGETIRDLYLVEIAKLMGAKGGYIASTNTTVATGSFGGWSTALAPYGVAPGAGHLANALFFEDGALVNDYLYRSAVPGQPHLNKMNTAIDMGGNNLNNTNAVNATSVNAAEVNAGTTITQGETFTGGWYRSMGDAGWYSEKWNGGWYMTDPDWVRSYQDKGIYTGGAIVGGSVQSLGRASFGEYLQVDGIATEGGGCSPNGLIGRNAAGLTLSCQSGVWKSNGGGTPSCTALTIPGYVANDVTTYACPVGYTKIGWDTTGQNWRGASTPGIIIGENDYATIFCCQF